MNYVKPEVTVLGDARSLIEAPPKTKDSQTTDSRSGPAYDLDE